MRCQMQDVHLCNDTKGRRPKAWGGGVLVLSGVGNASTCFNSPGGHFKTGFGFSLPKHTQTERSIFIITGQTCPSAVQKCLAIATTAQCFSIIPPNLNAWEFHQLPLSCRICFKAFLTLHNDMNLQQKHRNNDEVRRERVNHQLGTDMRMGL